MSRRKGYRGYIGSRAYHRGSAAQHIQNLVVRDYCQRNGFTYLLSATEYAMPGSYIILHEILREAGDIDGVVLYSIFMLPARQRRRLELCRRFLENGTSLHGASENLSITCEDDLCKVDEMLVLNQYVTDSARHGPSGSVYDGG